ncbi:MAG: P1 family peptidase [Anaerolineae bacterium]|jgi:D-aminopeptidase
MNRPRIRDLDLAPGKLPAGPLNAITDVAGVRIGHTTLISGEGPLRPGQGPVRTGVTVILPHGDDPYRHKVRGAVHTINGFGKVRGFEEVRELGIIESPIALTNTLNVGLVADALVQWAVGHNPGIGVRTSTANVIVGETHDGYLNDIQGRHVRAEHVWAAIEAAQSGPVVEGAVGAGTGTSCFGWKGGIGTASRVVPPEAGGWTVGALVQSNFGRAEDLLVCGAPVGRHISPPGASPAVQPDGRSIMADSGSIMIVLACDAPLSARQLGRLCVRAGPGLARTGSHYGHGSGDFVIAFSTGWRVAHKAEALTAQQRVLADEAKAMYWLFPAVVEAVEEAVLNSLFQAETVTGRDGHTRHALPVEEVAALLKRSERHE